MMDCMLRAQLQKILHSKAHLNVYLQNYFRSVCRHSYARLNGRYTIRHVDLSDMTLLYAHFDTTLTQLLLWQRLSWANKP